MAEWVLVCKYCGKAFSHSEIGGTLLDYFLPVKPRFPVGGLQRECPDCKTRSIYQQNELRYQE
jgi:hypothetical protein